jgi:hypothetical protein
MLPMVIEWVRAARFRLATWFVFIRTTITIMMMGERSSAELKRGAGWSAGATFRTLAVLRRVLQDPRGWCEDQLSEAVGFGVPLYRSVGLEDLPQC